MLVYVRYSMPASEVERTKQCGRLACIVHESGSKRCERGPRPPSIPVPRRVLLAPCDVLPRTKHLGLRVTS